jgi:hypothetical protein
MAEQMFYTIDLLKGRGIPKRKQKGLLLVVLAALALPVLIFIILLAQFFTVSIMLPVKQNELDKLTQQASTSKGAKIQKQISEYQNCLNQVAKTVNEQMQWSPIIEQAVMAMPDSMIMDNLNAATETTVEKVPSATDKNKTKTVKKTKRILNVTLFSDLNKFSENVMLAGVNDYIEKIRANCQFSGNITKQETQSIDSQRVKKYYIQFIKLQES